VNYHFGGKEELYAATLDYCFRIALEKYPPDWGVHPSDSPDLRLKAFVRSFVFRALEDGKHSWHSRLVTHEMNRPTAIFQQQLDRVMKPMAERLHDIVQAIVARPMGEDEIWRASASVISQVVFYKHCNTICERMMTQKYDVASLEQLADHIYRFALAGLRGLSAVEPHGGSAGH
jgi:AcrR family transcriptional regulator